MDIVENNVAAVVSWMLREGRFNTRMREFGHELCQRIVAAGIPIVRSFCYVGTLHPQVAASAYIWKRGEAQATRIPGEHGIETRADFAQSPLMAARRTRQLVRRRLEDAASFECSVFAEFRGGGGTDYVALPMVCSNGEVNVISFMTDRPGGFSANDIAGLEEVARALGIIVELQSMRRIAKTLLDTYVGARTGARVLSGAIRRGTGETIRAVVWINDLRQFTVASETLERDELIALLNDYFEIVARAVLAEQGEVLKFIGDGMLAVFELQPNETPATRCAAALRAACTAVAGIARCNRMRRSEGRPEIRFGIALHLGEVYYGNIGAPERLDFTVIGPAVNHTSRIEKLGSELGRIVVASANFAASAPEPLERLGAYNLRGIAETQEIFAPPMSLTID
jgi:adenylate cyclase